MSQKPPLVSIGLVLMIVVACICYQQIKSLATMFPAIDFNYVITRGAIPGIAEEEGQIGDDKVVLEEIQQHQQEVITISNATILQPGASWMPIGEEAFKRCSNLDSWMECQFDPSAVSTSHAVLFHARHLVEQSQVPEERPSGQKWVFYETEPPPKTWDRVDYDMDTWKQFNISATYATDADIMHSLYKLKCRKVKEWQPSGRNHAANKTKMAAWIVSNCNSDSRREVYVDELRKYVQVDEYGACGTDTHCGTYPEGAECIDRLLEKDYKFYLAFENGFCSEYYTEKIGKILDLNVIPVVMGSINYTEILPKDAFIDFKDFRSAAQLAKFLIYLDSNDTLYNEYVERKSQVQCQRLDSLPFPCKLCEYLHRHRDVTELVTDARDYWSLRKQCRSPKEVFSEFAPEILPQVTTPKGFKKLGID